MDAPLLAAHDNRLEKFIRLVAVVPLLDGLDGVFGCFALAQHKALDANLDALPPLVSVHDVVPPHHRRDLANANVSRLLQQLFHVALGALGVGIAAIAKEMNKYVRHAHLLGDAQQPVQMFLVAVHAAVRDQA